MLKGIVVFIEIAVLIESMLIDMKTIKLRRLSCKIERLKWETEHIKSKYGELMGANFLKLYLKTNENY